MDTDPYWSESDFCLIEIVTQIEEIFLGPERGDIDDILRTQMTSLFCCLKEWDRFRRG